MEIFTPLFQAVIAFVAVLTGLGIVFNLLLGPIKSNQAHFNRELREIKTKLDQLIAQTK